MEFSETKVTFLLRSQTPRADRGAAEGEPLPGGLATGAGLCVSVCVCVARLLG